MKRFIIIIIIIDVFLFFVLFIYFYYFSFDLFIYLYVTFSSSRVVYFRIFVFLSGVLSLVAKRRNSTKYPSMFAHSNLSSKFLSIANRRVAKQVLKPGFQHTFGNVNLLSFKSCSDDITQRF